MFALGGDDQLTGGHGNDVLLGGDGDDRISTSDLSGGDVVDGGGHVVGDQCVADDGDEAFAREALAKRARGRRTAAT